MRPFTELYVWKISHALAIEIYRATASFPICERYALTNQLRRAAVSIACNIAEGSRKTSNQDFARYLNISEGSLAEVEYLLILSRDLQYMDVETSRSLMARALDLAPRLRSLRRDAQDSVLPTSQPPSFPASQPLSEPDGGAEAETPAIQIDGAQ